MDIRVRLDDYLNHHGLTPYRLAQETKGQAAQGSIYALARGDSKRLDLKTLAAIMGALEKLTGENVGFDDLLERGTPRDPNLTAAGVPRTGDPETDALLNDIPDVLERIKQLEAGGSQTRPLREVMAELGLE